LRQQPIEVSNSGPSDLAFTPISAGFSAAQMRDPLRARLAASNAVFRYQPQIDPLTGRVAGVEALLCVPGLREYRPAVELAAEIEARWARNGARRAPPLRRVPINAEAVACLSL
jgi:hypothetical protein